MIDRITNDGWMDDWLVHFDLTGVRVLQDFHPRVLHTHTYTYIYARTERHTKLPSKRAHTTVKWRTQHTYTLYR